MSKKTSGTTKTKRVSISSEIKTNKPSTDLINLLHINEGFKCKNKTQKDFINLINDKSLIIAAGAAGTGKSFISIARSIELLRNPENKYKKIIIVTPAIEADEKLGFLPGSVREKLEPFVASSLDIFDKLIGKTNRTRLEELGYLEIQALAYIRGKSIDNSILIMEEAQNMSPNQMKTLLTRIGENSKFIISGDLDQSDRYRDFKQSGLYDAIQRHKNISEIGFIVFSNSEIVRNPLISKMIENYKNEDSEIKPKQTYKAKSKSKSFLQKFLSLFK